MVGEMNKIYVFYCENAKEIETANNNIKFVKLPCSGRLDEIMILKAFEDGAEGVIVLACYEGACKYLSGNIKAQKRIEYTKKILKGVGIEDKRLEMHYLQANQDEKFKEILKNFKKTVSE